MSDDGSTAVESDGNEIVFNSFDKFLDSFPCLSEDDEEEEEEEEKIVELNHGPLTLEYYQVECPFIWEKFGLAGELHSDFIDGVKTKLYPPKHWKIFSYTLYFVYVYCNCGETNKAIESLEFCEKFMDDHADEEFYQEIKESMIHTVNGTKAHFYYRIGDTDMADNIIFKVAPFKELGDESKAAVFSIQGHILFDISSKARRMALEKLYIAIELDPDEKGFRRGAWYYYAGKIIGQLRRMKKRSAMPTKEEMKLLERSIKIKPFPVALATLAESYREAATFMHFNESARANERLIHRLGNEARRLYRTAIQTNDLNASTLRRCGHGLMKLSPKLRDIPLAKKCLHRAVELDPNNIPGYFSLGLLAQRFDLNYGEALKYYQLSFEHGGIIAASFMIQIRYLMDGNYNPLNDCRKFFRILFGKWGTMADLAVIKGEYHLFKNNDLIEATKDWVRAILLAPTSDNILAHACRITRKKMIINVYDYLQDEIENAIKSNTYRKQDLPFLRKVLKICKNRDTMKFTSKMRIGAALSLVYPRQVLPKESISDELNLSLLFVS